MEHVPEQPCLRIDPLRRLDHVVLRLAGCLCHRSHSELGRTIEKALLNAGTALADLTRMQITEESGALVFAAALDAAGGWPRSRLTLYGGEPAVVQVLQRTGVTRMAPHVPTAVDALTSIWRRPLCVRTYDSFKPQMDMCTRARALLTDAAVAWEVPAPVLSAGLQVVTELATNVVKHARTVCQVGVEFDGQQLRLGVRDFSAAWPRVQPPDLNAQRDRGLQLVESLAAQWGVTERPGGKTVWAVMTPEGATLMKVPHVLSADQ